MRLAVLGLGEAGGLYAAGLVARGHDVRAFDPVAPTAPEGVDRRDDARAAVAAAESVLSLVGAAAAERALGSVLGALPPSCLFADMSTGSPEQKRRLAASAAEAGTAFVDVAIMSPVPRAGLLTPVLASGDGGERFVAAVTGWGVPARFVGPDAGSAAALKLLRSVFMKGLAALVFESVTAAERIGAGSWIRTELAGELGPGGAELVERLLSGTRQHAERRKHEMQDVQAFLTSLDAPAWMTTSTIRWLQAIAAGEA